MAPKSSPNAPPLMAKNPPIASSATRQNPWDRPASHDAMSRASLGWPEPNSYEADCYRPAHRPCHTPGHQLQSRSSPAARRKHHCLLTAEDASNHCATASHRFNLSRKNSRFNLRRDLKSGFNQTNARCRCADVFPSLRRPALAAAWQWLRQWRHVRAAHQRVGHQWACHPSCVPNQC